MRLFRSDYSSRATAMYCRRDQPALESVGFARRCRNFAKGKVSDAFRFTPVNVALLHFPS